MPHRPPVAAAASTDVRAPAAWAPDRASADERVPLSVREVNDCVRCGSLSTLSSVGPGAKADEGEVHASHGPQPRRHASREVAAGATGRAAHEAAKEEGHGAGVETIPEGKDEEEGEEAEEEEEEGFRSDDPLDEAMARSDLAAMLGELLVERMAVVGALRERLERQFGEGSSLQEAEGEEEEAGDMEGAEATDGSVEMAVEAAAEAEIVSGSPTTPSDGVSLARRAAEIASGSSGRQRQPSLNEALDRLRNSQFSRSGIALGAYEGFDPVAHTPPPKPTLGGRSRALSFTG